jgi:NAD(P)-dependent dehydrogenase (short-subunit alcohol dehydrogenase family)
MADAIARGPAARRPLAGRVAVVTGASSGIGRATATALARAGAHPVLVSRSRPRLEAAAREVDHAGGGASPALLLPCDVSDPVAVRRMADRACREAGVPDIVVSNAGIGHWAPVAALPLARLRAILEVNFLGAVHVTQAFLPGLLERGRGSLVFVSSGFGALPFPNTAAYCASKHALNGFAGSLRAEVAPLGLHVLLVLPGGTRTPFFATNAYPAEVLSRYLLQPSLSSERVAERIVRAIVRRRSRLVIGRLNDLGLRLFGAFPELERAFLGFVGRRLLARDPVPGERP